MFFIVTSNVAIPNFNAYDIQKQGDLKIDDIIKQSGYGIISSKLLAYVCFLTYFKAVEVITSVQLPEAPFLTNKLHFMSPPKIFSCHTYPSYIFRISCYRDFSLAAP